jgi:hypothetical protein
VSRCSELLLSNVVVLLTWKLDRSLNSAINGSIMLYLASPSLFGVTISILPIVAYSGMKMSKLSRYILRGVMCGHWLR